MDKKIVSLIVLFTMIIISSFSQEKSKKELREELRFKKQQEVENLINNKEFVFVARTAIPQGYRSINLTTNPNSIKFFPDMIESDLPFFGRAYGAAGYGDQGGMKFKGKPEDYTFTKAKKGYEITASVRDEAHSYTIRLTVGTEGSGTLTINSNYRSAMSYHGDITAPK